jgi:2-succinyl-6-hydroxy-2,4-cyclohexadiene-1-carboxylate synthase
MWDRVVAAGDARCMLLPGHGPQPQMRADFRSVVDSIAASIDQPTTVVGYSMGARLALSLALTHPACVRRAILIGVNPGLEDAAARDERRGWEERQAQHLQQHGIEAFVASWEALPLFETQRTLPVLVREAVRRDRLAQSAAGLAWAMRTLGLGSMPSYWSVPEEANVELRLITGALDDKFTSLAKRFVNTVPNASHRIVDGVGHNVVLEAPQTIREELAAE